MQAYHQYYAIVGQVIVGGRYTLRQTNPELIFAAVILIVRTHALYGRSRRVLVALSTLGFILAAVHPATLVGELRVCY